MKIIYLHQYFNTPSMSGGTRSYEMARRMVASGHEVHMVTSWRGKADDNSDWFTSNEQGIVVHWLPVPYSNKMSYVKRIKAFFAFAIAARKKAIQLGGDVIFATSTPLTISIPAVLAAKKNRIPMVFEVRDLWPELPIAMGALNNPISIFLAKQLERWAYRNSDVIVALSPGMKDGVVNAGYPKEQVVVIPNSSDNQEFIYDAAAAARFRSAREWLGDRPLIVYTGTFGRINGVGYMVDLAKALLTINPEIRILLVGGGQEWDLVIAQAKAEGVYEKNIFFESSLPKNEIPALLSAATMATSLFIDIAEMQPNSANKFFDALASGTPIMINYGGWQDALITQHRCGLPMWRVSIQEVAEKVAEKIIDQHWLAMTGQAARKLAEEKFDRGILASQLEKAIVAAVNRDAANVDVIASGNYS